MPRASRALLGVESTAGTAVGSAQVITSNSASAPLIMDFESSMLVATVKLENRGLLQKVS